MEAVIENAKSIAIAIAAVLLPKICIFLFLLFFRYRSVPFGSYVRKIFKCYSVVNPLKTLKSLSESLLSLRRRERENWGWSLRKKVCN
jgi:hypothetical protein